MKSNCSVISGAFGSKLRKKNEKSVITHHNNTLELTYFNEDSLEMFESSLNEHSGNSSVFFSLKKRLGTTLVSVVSVVVILFALISSSLYEDMLKKVIFEAPFDWTYRDTISFMFVILFFVGLLMMPSILEGESSQFKDVLRSWFNKDARIEKRLKMLFHTWDKKHEVRVYNADLICEEHWLWRLVIPLLMQHFVSINLYVRNDQKRTVTKRLEALGCMNINVQTQTLTAPMETLSLLSTEEENLYRLMQLSSTNSLVSLELFEYCGRSFMNVKSTQDALISGFQNFINRAFDDFALLHHDKNNHIALRMDVNAKGLEDEKRRLSYYLRNHIEECLEYFDDPVSLLVLYYYVKDIVLDEKRLIGILEKLIECIKKKQHYHLIKAYWFDIAQEMFDPTNLDTFALNNESLYRKISIERLGDLIFLFERSGYFEQARFIAQYLYPLNPNKYAVDICSLYEREGNFDAAFEALRFKAQTSQKPTDIQVRFHQRQSWIIVSQRRIKDKALGEASIKAMEELLFGHDQNNEPLWLWHFYNIQANYAEWNEQYDLAIEFYKKCLTVPALGSFEYGATFLNMSIAYRFKFFTKDTHNLDTIRESIKIGGIGVTLKASVGDRDEMPVVLHNQSLNILYYMAFNEETSLLQDVQKLTQEGMEILDSTDSKKRLGMMLIESIIVNTLIHKETHPYMHRLKEHWQIMDEYEKTQAIKIYELFVAQNKCKRLDWMYN